MTTASGSDLAIDWPRPVKSCVVDWTESEETISMPFSSASPGTTSSPSSAKVAKVAL